MTKRDAETNEVYETIAGQGNLLMYGGASAVWESLIGHGSTLGNDALTYFNDTNAAIGVGTSSSRELPTQTNLAAGNPNERVRAGMDMGYPQHKPGNSEEASSVTFSSTFGRNDANFDWREWGIFNSTRDGAGIMLNRKVPEEGLGSKTSKGTWTLTVTLTLK